MEPIIVPEPSELEREALLDALRADETARPAARPGSGWREAALREAVAAEPAVPLRGGSAE